ncbi:hypothetical protein KCV87_20685 [Actinosynnema pretiosum subsp. pretiosum]|uniref:Uncharacterized protein n=2 Tax=Actinosynnema TaxID=40566 RepID=C6WSI1_ACTMD|nr:Imm1 family immunity protein [Actinosynnema mirum]ACU40851.1 hypothetical protein Amir_7060 [Actinosynnema mirum DSM 43827]AXX34363.1 hypothetical protein APASM_6998 [Actinosynnema pretiosum subsp. pretiosum]QUF01941.1 hypothetical protein KCV87_20685 [Actinosynnema pretiosum subsp. pretiosum]
MPQVEFRGEIEGRRYRPGSWTASSSEEVSDALDRIFNSPWEFRTECVIRIAGLRTGLRVLVYLKDGRTTLLWAGTHRSKNPTPFPDAPLIAEDRDSETPLHLRRDSYLSRESARSAVLEYLATGERPTCIEWQPESKEAYALPEPVEGMSDDLWGVVSLITGSTPEADARRLREDQEIADYCPVGRPPRIASTGDEPLFRDEPPFFLRGTE